MAKLVLVSGLVLVAVAGALTLSEAPPRVVRGDGSNSNVAFTVGSFNACQTGEVLPQGASAIRVGVAADVGPPVRISAYSGSRLIAQGSHPPNWTGSSVTVPFASPARTTDGVKLCLSVGPNSEPVYIYGREALPYSAAVSVTGETLPGRVGVEYLAQGSGSWWSRALLVARHMGIGHALSGSWVALLVALLVGALTVLTVRLAWKALP